MLQESDLIPYNQLSPEERGVADFAMRGFDMDPKTVKYLRTEQYGLCWGTWRKDSKMMAATPLEHPFECACCGAKTETH